MFDSYSKGALYGKIKYLAVKKTEKILTGKPIHNISFSMDHSNYLVL